MKLALSVLTLLALCHTKSKHFLTILDYFETNFIIINLNRV